MLQIRQAQMAEWVAAQREAFIVKTLGKLVQLFPEDPAVRDEVAMRALINDGINRAAGHEITQDREVSLFIFLMKEYGPDFAKMPGRDWSERILANRDYDQQEKMDLIYNRLERLAATSGA